jgi:DNA gyrase/topoisomerase IV subunit A
VIREIKADAEKHGDARRTIIQPAATASRSEVAAVADEPVTVIISEKGWARVARGMVSTCRASSSRMATAPVRRRNAARSTRW